MDDRYIIGIGGLNYDIHVKLAKSPVPGDSNPAGVQCSAGGVTRNILENLVRLEHRCLLLSSVGTDGFGQAVRQECEDAGLDVSRLREDKKLPTSTYINVLEPGGEVYIAANDMRIHEAAPLSYFEENAELIRSAQAVVTDANLTEKQLSMVMEIADGVPVFADTVSAAKCRRLLPFIGKIQLIKPNLMELEALSGIECSGPDADKKTEAAAEKLLSTGLKSIAVSLGSRGCYYADRSGKRLYRRLDCDLPVVNAGGAGDAFMAGLTAGFCEGLEPENALDLALACGRITTLSESTVDPRLTREFAARFLDRYAT
ncbi:MAG: carbohydrate kinase family protein [Firmicutes bacterium]|nr:carbohydrate kinase family protein [Bacillota bacterium]